MLNIVGYELEAPIRPPPTAVRGGTREGWQAAIEAAVSVEGCPHWTLGVGSAFVGPVLGLCDFPTCGICYSGPTSRGKTTALALGCSAWSNPHLTSGGLLRSMNTTQNAIELTARHQTTSSSDSPNSPTSTAKPPAACFIFFPVAPARRGCRPISHRARPIPGRPSWCCRRRRASRKR